MKIQITGAGEFLPQSKDKPVIGRTYTLEDAVIGTAAQNRAFHAVLDAFWKWMFNVDKWKIPCDPLDAEKGEYNFHTPDAKKFKLQFKRAFCNGIKGFKYSSENHTIEFVEIMEDVPIDIVIDYTNGNKKRIEPVDKSWSDFTVKERRHAIDTLKMFVGLFGCDDKKVQEILDGMEEKK